MADVGDYAFIREDGTLVRHTWIDGVLIVEEEDE